MPKNGKTKTVGREAKSGRFVVTGMEKIRGGKVWTLAPKKGGKGMTVVTTKSSADSFDRISRKHGKALERLAKK